MKNRFAFGFPKGKRDGQEQGPNDPAIQVYSDLPPTTPPVDTQIRLASSSPSQSGTDDLIRHTTVQVERRAGEWVPYTGKDRLIIAIDIGTTFSGASFCILQNNKKPEIHDVTGYQGQSTGHSKVPSVIIYDHTLRPKMYGDPAAEHELDEGELKAQCWKLHLKPHHMQLVASEHNVLEPLPAGLTVDQIFQDFLLYMIKSTAAFIKTRQADGDRLLNELADSAEYVLTVPNGWETEQQERMRKCCVNAGLVGPQRSSTIHFLTEGEASINYCASKLSTVDWLNESGKEVLVVDAGGGTVDITTYSVEQTSPKLMVRETSASECLLVGSATIDRQAHAMLQERLRGSVWDTPADLAALQREFSKKIKEKFASAGMGHTLKYGGGYTSQEHGIIQSKIKLSGNDIASLFEYSINNTVSAIRKRVKASRASGHPVIAMVGGFSESPYYRNEVQLRLGDTIKMCKPDGATNKAVAHGAVAWFLDGCVSAHVARFDYGVRCSVKYDASKPQHQASDPSRRVMSSTGELMLTQAFGTILKRGQESSVHERHVEEYRMTWRTDEQLVKDVVVFAYRGTDAEAPEFLSDGPFDQLVTFQVDLEAYRHKFPVQTGPNGTQIIQLPLKLAMKLNGAEVDASASFTVQGQSFTQQAAKIIDSVGA
ncbi:hypothetical protein OC834_005713 [Tilletia horrida]|uniref:Uncharacterized protein n=1 Tax=Tilletia horrida TaxID=155126 RepID=A0AAN6G9N3_9BASI|nr:hypothetical protein OC834_005713 [Tilletia horrida]KAK0524757.1 hypothetical protein OC835_005828 [Tilletia horrida]KAK0528882.1 hypothetical protein OC842_004420 [Tilletia horrida]KAK0556488.1 hypothetical protein OC844_005839 [Tilletia horrida]